jgi:hypothetical protein
MRGLVVNNLYTSRDNIKLSLIIALLLAFVPLFVKENSIISIVIAMQTFVLVSNMSVSLKMDEASKWNKFEITLPVARNTLISAKYISFILLILIGVAASLVTVALQAIRGKIDFNTLILGYNFGLQLSLSTVAIVYPLILKLGAEKSDTLLFMAIGLSVGLRFMVWYLLYLSDETITFRTSPVVGNISLAISLALFILSYFISAAIHRYKEF